MRPSVTKQGNDPDSKQGKMNMTVGMQKVLGMPPCLRPPLMALSFQAFVLMPEPSTASSRSDKSYRDKAVGIEGMGNFAPL